MAEKTGLGLKKETSAALSYVLGPITGVVFLVIDKDPFVRFHAMQSIVVFIALFAIQWMLGLTIVLALLVPIVGIISFILWLILIYKAWQGKRWEAPFVGKLVNQLLTKV